MIHGQYPMHTGCYENTVMPTDGRETFMEALTKSGYRTHGIGKCHFTPDRYALRGLQSREVQEEGGEMQMVHGSMSAYEQEQAAAIAASQKGDGVNRPVRAERQPNRNDPCPCGSGRKFKQCCGGR